MDERVLWFTITGIIVTCITAILAVPKRVIKKKIALIGTILCGAVAAIFGAVSTYREYQKQISSQQEQFDTTQVKLASSLLILQKIVDTLNILKDSAQLNLTLQKSQNDQADSILKRTYILLEQQEEVFLNTERLLSPLDTIAIKFGIEIPLESECIKPLKKYILGIKEAIEQNPTKLPNGVLIDYFFKGDNAPVVSYAGLTNFTLTEYPSPSLRWGQEYSNHSEGWHGGSILNNYNFRFFKSKYKGLHGLEKPIQLISYTGHICGSIKPDLDVDLVNKTITLSHNCRSFRFSAENEDAKNFGFSDFLDASLYFKAQGGCSSYKLKYFIISDHSKYPNTVTLNISEKDAIYEKKNPTNKVYIHQIHKNEFFKRKLEFPKNPFLNDNMKRTLIKDRR